MKLIPDDLMAKLRANGEFNEHLRNSGKNELDYMPVVKLFNPCGAATWLLTEISPDDNDSGFATSAWASGTGLCQPQGNPERQGALGIGIERDESFRATKTLSAYADEARKHQRIVE